MDDWWRLHWENNPKKHTRLPSSDCAFVFRCILFCACSAKTDKYVIVFVMSCLHRETWPLKPPEVHDAVLQFAGWGPRGEQLVRRPCPRDYSVNTGTLVEICQNYPGIADGAHKWFMVFHSWTDNCCGDKRFMCTVMTTLRISRLSSPCFNLHQCHLEANVIFYFHNLETTHELVRATVTDGLGVAQPGLGQSGVAGGGSTHTWHKLECVCVCWFGTIYIWFTDLVKCTIWLVSSIWFYCSSYLHFNHSCSALFIWCVYEKYWTTYIIKFSKLVARRPWIIKHL